MSRESENTLLLLIGLATGMITITGAFTRYVKPALMPWLYVTAALLIGLALVAMVDDVRRRAGHGDGHESQGGLASQGGHGHSHSNLAAWLLLVPVVVLIFITPPALLPQANVPSVRAVPTEALRRPFPPLPAGRAPEVPIPSVMLRAAQDSAGTLNDRLITVVGFTVRDGDSVRLGRFMVMCCVADARLAEVRLGGAAAEAAGRFPEYTWLRVEGIVQPGRADGDSSVIPTLEVVTVTEIAPPEDVYA